MALWHIVRIEQENDASGTLVCATGEYAAKIELEDLDTGLHSTINACFSTHEGQLCANMGILRGAGYTPADWDTECPA